MTRRFVSRVLALSILVAVAFNLVLIAAILVARVEFWQVRSRYGQPVAGYATPALSGVAVDGTAVGPSRAAQGTAVWYASKECPYCQRDEEWEALAPLLAADGMRVLILLPFSAHGFPPDSRKQQHGLQIAFIAREWITHFPLNVTPTLLILDGDDRLVWHKRGVLSPADSARALRAAKAVARRQ